MKKLLVFFFAMLILSCAKVTDPSERPVKDSVDLKIYDTIPVPIPRDSSTIIIP